MTPALGKELKLGPKSAAMLKAAGIHSFEQLRELGAVATYVKVKRLDNNASLNLLYALVGALEGCDWRTVQREYKLGLLMALEDYEKQHG